jgi:transposase
MSTTTDPTVTVIGVGLDTARYGHHVTFLNEKRELAAKPFDFLESRTGYQQLEKTLGLLANKHPNVHFQIRVDAAGQYATNLVAFLHQLPWPKTVSVGEPTRNKRYRQVHFPKRKADATESHSCSRFAIVEQPEPTPQLTPEILTLQEVASRLEFQVKQSTRQVNRLHNLLGRVFPELATLQNDLQAHWLLRMLDKYPTAERIAKARLNSLTAIPHLNKKKACQLQEAAKESVAAERGKIMEELVRQSVRGLLQSLDAEKQLEKLLLEAFAAVPDERTKRIATINGIGKRTAAVLVAKIGSIDRFPTANHLTSYFGVFPEENTSGLDKYGNPVQPGTMRMSRKGNDLVRKHLWMAAFSAIGRNPQVKALYARLRARGRRGDVALGHCMRKLLHQVFGIWTTGQAYDPDYGRKDKPTSCDSEEPSAAEEGRAAGRKTGISPERKAVTATSSTIDGTPQTVNQPAEVSTPSGDAPSHGAIDFPYLRSQITLERVLRHLGYFDRLRGSGPQRRGPCPVHGAKRDRGRTFSVHLGKNVHQCFHPPCGVSGNVLDLWCQIHQLTTYEGAIHLAKTFDLDPHPEQRRGTRNRNP